MCLEKGGTSRKEQSALMAGVGLPARRCCVLLKQGRWEMSDVAKKESVGADMEIFLLECKT
jgi:hypothetical protein